MRHHLHPKCLIEEISITMNTFFTYDDYQAAANMVRSRTRHQPTIGMILGSGLGELAEQVEDADRIPYGEIENWPTSSVVGHKGQLVIGMLEGQSVLVMQGRAHLYEGYPLHKIALPIRVMQLLNIHTLIITNAAGGIHQDFQAGDVMLITDHINMVGMNGLNPLIGPNLEQFGPRFPDMRNAYDPELRALAQKVANENDVPLQQGVYCGLSGPSFETPADLRFLRAVGSDAVGMSTVAEVTVARHGGTRVLGFSGISNKVNLDGDTPTNHEEVLEAGKTIVPKLTAIVRGVLRELRALPAND